MYEISSGSGIALSTPPGYVQAARARAIAAGPSPVARERRVHAVGAEPARMDARQAAPVDDPEPAVGRCLLGERAVQAGVGRAERAWPDDVRPDDAAARSSRRQHRADRGPEPLDGTRVVVRAEAQHQVARQRAERLHAGHTARRRDADVGDLPELPSGQETGQVGLCADGERVTDDERAPATGRAAGRRQSEHGEEREKKDRPAHEAEDGRRGSGRPRPRFATVPSCPPRPSQAAPRWFVRTAASSSLRRSSRVGTPPTTASSARTAACSCRSAAPSKQRPRPRRSP